MATLLKNTLTTNARHLMCTLNLCPNGMPLVMWSLIVLFLQKKTAIGLLSIQYSRCYVALINHTQHHYSIPVAANVTNRKSWFLCGGY